MEPEVRGGGGLNDQETNEEKCCWICFATEEDNRLAKWVKPCQCRGTTKWVHQSCLYRWIDEKQKGNSRRAVVCQQCQTEYVMVFPELGRFATILEWMDLSIRKTSPYLAAGVFMGTIYWTAITYGAITVVQVLGQKRGIELMENGDPFVLLVGLPIIPVALVLARLIRWEDAVLHCLRSRYNIFRKLPFLSWLGEPDDLHSGDSSASLPPTPAVTEPLYVSRIFCGAILLPTFATVTGNLFFKGLEDPLHRTLIGGACYIGLKGLLKIYLRQKLYIRRRRRRIADYTDDNVRIYMGGEIREAPPIQDGHAHPDMQLNPSQRGNNNGPRQNAGHDDYVEVYATPSSTTSVTNYSDRAEMEEYMDARETSVGEIHSPDYRQHYLNADVQFYSVVFPMDPPIVISDIDMELD